ncbi:HET-domain-containing protein [Plenodomus tracheiphilus IPT5]|uniref:HET-domain-containing protein n=1 Tax=Plenodomus tracheiphilus IPT5 TaxID=1408161 RepID=A0A6A7BG48_9PLEO|nr:HET-domain-containing protein [Plenodomus tracheiphilus IPT5]
MRRTHADASLPGFEVIDCRSHNFPPDIVERPWTERYVALSCVWGPSSDDWPQTILDAIEMTKRMGERYLWVDRTCIDQSNVARKMNLISKMDAMYDGAEFTIVCASGDARSGLSGVCATSRRSQPFVQLVQNSEKSEGKTKVKFAPGSLEELLGVSEDDYLVDIVGETGWLDDGRFGLGGKSDFNFEVLLENQRLPLKETIPNLLREIATEGDEDPNDIEVDKIPITRRPWTHSSKPRRPLPQDKTASMITLISTMQEPRSAVKQSSWATRGWSYQEGVLPNRRLVFTEEQVYRECRGMAVCETVDLALDLVHEPSGVRMADFMLSGIFDGDLHHDSELQYGFGPALNLEDTGDKVVALDGHIDAFTLRNLTNEDDAPRAFQGVANTYTTDHGLSLLLRLPVWGGASANAKPGLQHTFALSVTSWIHIVTPQGRERGLVIADCIRRPQFPSWTRAGWQDAVEFCNERQRQKRRIEWTSKNMGFLIKSPDSGVRFTVDDHDVETSVTVQIIATSSRRRPARIGLAKWIIRGRRI